MKKRCSKNKKAVSDLIAAILLILIAMAAGAMVYGIVIPLIKGNIASAQACSDAGLEIATDEGLTCYTGSEAQIEIKRSEKDVNLSGIQLQVFGAGKSKAVVVNASINSAVKEYKQASYGAIALTLPDKNEARTYVINLASAGITSPSSVAAAPIVRVGSSDKLCDVSASSAISGC